MALPNSGPLTLSDIAAEFGGSTPHTLGEYYGVSPLVPSSGTLSISDFYGTSAEGAFRFTDKLLRDTTGQSLITWSATTNDNLVSSEKISDELTSTFVTEARRTRDVFVKLYEISDFIKTAMPSLMTKRLVSVRVYARSSYIWKSVNAHFRLTNTGYLTAPNNQIITLFPSGQNTLTFTSGYNVYDVTIPVDLPMSDLATSGDPQELGIYGKLTWGLGGYDFDFAISDVFIEFNLSSI